MGGHHSRNSDDLLLQQRTLARFGELALKSETLDDILTEACRLVGDTLGTDLAKVIELQPDGETLFVRAGVGWKAGVVGQIRLHLHERSSEGHAIRTGEPVISRDIDKETRFEYPDFLKDNGVKAIVNVLILGTKGKPPYGILQVDSREPREFAENDITFLRGYANLLAAAVERLRVLTDTRALNEALEARVAERTRELTAANRRLRSEMEERERVEAALRQAERVETLVEHLPIGAGLVSPSGRVVVANPEFLRLLPQPRPLGNNTEEKGQPGAGEGPENLVSARALRGEVVRDLDILHHEGSADAHWLRAGGVPVRDEVGMVVAALVTVMDVDTQKRASDRQELLARELDHRAKNMLAVVQAALRLTKAESLPDFVRAIEGRVAALARAQSLLASDRWSGADLTALLRGELDGFLDGGGSGPRADLNGPTVVLPPGAAQPLSMVIHELATNAVKYGALSVPPGRVFIEWRVAGSGPGTLQLRWTETGGPALSGPPARRGFGSRVLEGTLRGQLGGSLATDWQAAGLVCNLEVPLGLPSPPL